MIVSYKGGMSYDVTLPMQKAMFDKREQARRLACAKRIGGKMARMLSGKVENLCLQKHEVMGVLLETGRGLAKQYGCAPEHTLTAIATAASLLTQKGVIPNLVELQ